MRKAVIFLGIFFGIIGILLMLFPEVLCGLTRGLLCRPKTIVIQVPTNACFDRDGLKHLGESGRVVTDENGFYRKVIVVTDPAASVYNAPNDQAATIANSAVIWTYFYVFDISNGFCQVGPPGGQPVGWINNDDLRPVVHMVSARLRTAVVPGDQFFYNFSSSSGPSNPVSGRATAGTQDYIGHPIIKTDTYEGVLYFQLLVLIRNPETGRREAHQVWSRADNFEQEIYATRSSLEELIRNFSEEADDLDNPWPRFGIGIFEKLFIQSRGVIGKTDINQYARFCADVPPANPRDARDKIPLGNALSNEIIVERLRDSAQKLENDYINNFDNWQNFDNSEPYYNRHGTMIPVEVMPQILDTAYNYELCRQ